MIPPIQSIRPWTKTRPNPPPRPTGEPATGALETEVPAIGALEIVGLEIGALAIVGPEIVGPENVGLATGAPVIGARASRYS